MKRMKKLLTIILILVLLCSFTACSEEPQTTANNHSDWIWVSNTQWEGALSEQGYYYGNQALSYCDFATEKHAVLCSKVGCKHDDEGCDAYTSTIFGRNMFFGNNYIYYLQHDHSGKHLFRRDATGAALTSVGIPGEYYIKQQKSVDISHLTLAGHYLYYRGSVGRDVGETITLDLEFIARMDLSTGKEEILIEETMESPGDHLWICAVQEDGVIFSRYITPKIDRDDPGYPDALKKATNSLKMWREDTGEVTTLLQKTIEEFSQVRGVFGGKVFYSTLTTQDSTDLYAYDLTTGKDEHWISGGMWHLGGGYVLLQRDDRDGYDIFNLMTKRKLSNALNDIAYGGVGYIRCVSDKGLILQWSGKELRKVNESDDYGYADVHRDYITYASLANGLQQEDLIPILVDEVMTSRVEAPDTTSTTETTLPTQPEEETPIIYTPMEPYPNDGVTVRTQYLPETVKNPDDLPILKWAVLSDKQGTSITYREDALHDLNKMLSDKNMPYRVQLVVMSCQRDDNLEFSYMDWFSHPEATEVLRDADLIFATMGPSQRQQYLIPLTEYIRGDAQPSLKNAVPHEICWLTGSVDEEIYGISTSFARPTSMGWEVDMDFMEQQGLTPGDFSGEFWEMDKLLAKLTKANGGKPVLAIRDNIGVGLNISMTNISLGICPQNYQPIGALFAVKLADDAPKVVNLLEDDTLRSIRSAVMRYKAAGYVTTSGSKAAMEAKITYTAIPGSAVFIDSGKVRIPGGPTTQAIGYSSSPIVGITTVSEHKEKALSLLHLIAEDEVFRNQLCYGTEGQDYNLVNGTVSEIVQTTTIEETKVEQTPNGPITSVIKHQESVLYSMSALSPLSGFGMLSDEALHRYPCYEGKTKLETYREMVDCATYTDYPVVFDYSELLDDLEEMGYALGKHFENEYMYDFYAIPEEEYDQMLKDVKAVGGEKIQAELQRQLDAWLAENPDWQ